MAERTGSRLKRGDVGRRHLFAASQTVNFPGTSDCPASNTQSEIALLPVLPSFLPSLLLSALPSFSPTTFRPIRRGEEEDGVWRRQSRLREPNGEDTFFLRGATLPYSPSVELGQHVFHHGCLRLPSQHLNVITTLI